MSRPVDPMRGLIFVLAFAATPLAARAQQQPPAQPPAGQQPATVQQVSPDSTKRAQTAGVAPAPVVNAGEAQLMFEREIFSYPGRGRRDPFAPLTGDNAGPLFSDLKLNMILYVADAPAESIVTITDASKKVHRVRRGDTIGNATIVDIGPNRVVFSINDFGVRRQAVLDLKPQTQGREP